MELTASLFGSAGLFLTAPHPYHKHTLVMNSLLTVVRSPPNNVSSIIF